MVNWNGLQVGQKFELTMANISIMIAMRTMVQVVFVIRPAL